jgi:organic hydroperoxide reductase OsmC/OhrA
MGRVVLRPRVRFAGTVDDAALAELHHKSHENCFIANSVNTSVSIEPRN